MFLCPAGGAVGGTDEAQKNEAPGSNDKPRRSDSGRESKRSRSDKEKRRRHSRDRHRSRERSRDRDADRDRRHKERKSRCIHYVCQRPSSAFPSESSVIGHTASHATAYMQDIVQIHSILLPCLCWQRLKVPQCIVLVKCASVTCKGAQRHLTQFFLRGCAPEPTEACLCRSKRSRSRDRDAERSKRSRHDRSHHSRDRISPTADKQHAGEEEREGGSTAATSAPAFVPKAQPKGLVVVKAKKFDGCYSQLVDAMLDSQPRQVGHQGCNFCMSIPSRHP